MMIKKTSSSGHLKQQVSKPINPNSQFQFNSLKKEKKIKKKKGGGGGREGGGRTT